MTLAELMNKCQVYLDDEENITVECLSAEVEVNYYWYHHMMPDNTRKYIECIIQHGMYNEFALISDELNSDEICYLPQEASIYIDEEYIGALLLDGKTSLKMITHSECECG